MALTLDANNVAGAFPQTLEPLPNGGVLKVWAGVVDLDNSYATNGYTLTPALFGMTTVRACTGGVTSTGKLCTQVATTGKLKVFSAIGTEVVNTTDLSAETVNLVVVGV